MKDLGEFSAPFYIITFKFSVMDHKCKSVLSGVVIYETVNFFMN